MIDALRLLSTNAPLSIEEAQSLMQASLKEETTTAQIGAMLGLLHHRAPTAELLAGFALELARHRIHIDIPRGLRDQLVDVCGTGGDGKNGMSTFNVSTTVAFLANACGVPIAKHGNRAVSSRSGSFDVLESLGVPFSQDPLSAQKALVDSGFAFLFAPAFQPALKNIGPVRKSVGLRTLFNALGPLLNPAEVKRQVIGVYDEALLVPMAEALKTLGAQHALIVHGSDGLDEITLTGFTHAVELKNSVLRKFTIDPADFGITLSSPALLQGGDSETNARITETILSGEEGPRADLVCLNTAAALLVSGRASTLLGGFTLARSIQRSGAGLDVLNRVRLVERDSTLKRAAT